MFTSPTDKKGHGSMEKIEIARHPPQAQLHLVHALAKSDFLRYFSHALRIHQHFVSGRWEIAIGGIHVLPEKCGTDDARRIHVPRFLASRHPACG